MRILVFVCTLFLPFFEINFFGLNGNAADSTTKSPCEGDELQKSYCSKIGDLDSEICLNKELQLLAVKSKSESLEKGIYLKRFDEDYLQFKKSFDDAWGQRESLKIDILKYYKGKLPCFLKKCLADGDEKVTQCLKKRDL